MKKRRGQAGDEGGGGVRDEGVFEMEEEEFEEEVEFEEEGVFEEVGEGEDEDEDGEAVRETGLERVWPERAGQAEALRGLLGRAGDACRTVHVYGGATTGKTGVVRAVMAGRPHAYVNCVEGAGSGTRVLDLLLLSLRRRLLGWRRDAAPGPAALARRCGHVSDFVEMLRATIAEYARRKTVRRGRRRAGEAAPAPARAEDETVYLVLDNAERLRGVDGGKCLAGLLCLGEVCWELPPAEARVRIGVVFVSRLGWDAFRCAAVDGREPFRVHLPDYGEEDLARILAREGGPASADRRAFSEFVRCLVGEFHPVTRNLHELKGLATQMYPRYGAGPARSGAATQAAGETDWGALNQRIRQHMRHFMQTSYCRDIVGFSASADADGVGALGGPRAGRVGETSASAAASASALHLPRQSKYLLVSAYLASRNRAREDAGIFCVTVKGARRSKRKNLTKDSLPDAGDAFAAWRHAPSAFPLERLLALYRCLLSNELSDEDGRHYAASYPLPNDGGAGFAPAAEDDEGWGALEPARVPLVGDVFFAISTLVSQNLLTQAGDDLVSLKYRCNIGDEVVEQVARSVGIALHKYIGHGRTGGGPAAARRAQKQRPAGINF